MKPVPQFFGALAALALALSAASAATAAEFNGVRMPDQVKVGEKTLKLNGFGLRQATFLKVNVYGAGLYLEKPSHDGEAIANSDELKSIEMVFLRDVDAGKTSEAWEEGIEKNCL